MTQARLGAVNIAPDEPGHDLLDQEGVLAVDEEIELSPVGSLVRGRAVPGGRVMLGACSADGCRKCPNRVNNATPRTIVPPGRGRQTVRWLVWSSRPPDLTLLWLLPNVLSRNSVGSVRRDICFLDEVERSNA
jgi:hypothetical protein